MIYSCYRLRLQPPSPETFSALILRSAGETLLCVRKRKVCIWVSRFCPQTKFLYERSPQRYQPSEVFLANFYWDWLETSVWKKNIIVSRADKSCGFVITNKANYIDSMSRTLPGPAKLEIISEPIRKFCTKIEDIINRFLSQLKKLKCIDENTYSR